MLVDRERRALHDMLARTAVVYDWGERPAKLPAPLTRYLERKGVALELGRADAAATSAGSAAE